MTGPGGTNVLQACAACKHQRRKCAPDCALAPYFPPHRHTEFLNVHKLFGIKKIMNTVRNVDPDQREMAVRSMIQEAALRVMDPVCGSCGIVNNLHDMCNQIKFELDLVLQQLAICRGPQIDGDNGEMQSKVRSFYDDLTAQNSGNVPLLSQTVDKASNISPPHCNNIQTSKKVSSSEKDEGVEDLQIVPYETNGAIKMSNFNKNNESPTEIE